MESERHGSFVGRLLTRVGGSGVVFPLSSSHTLMYLVCGSGTGALPNAVSCKVKLQRAIQIRFFVHTSTGPNHSSALAMHSFSADGVVKLVSLRLWTASSMRG